ncbi:hypothetical protein AB0L70_12375 [Kribbella sp. NPDC051952]|uniref:hypothetical protein n=1 Tax=Kribbella sp. NPDC051952 TaxID=3154851 RepID=UPI0034131B6E
MRTLIVEVFDGPDGESSSDGRVRDHGDASELAEIRLWLDDEQLEPVDRIDGTCLFEFPDRTDLSRLRLASGGTRVSLPQGLQESIEDPSQSARLFITRPVTDVPYASPFEPRVCAESAKQMPPPATAGVPGDGQMPLSGVATKQLVNYITPALELRPENDWCPGYLYELESNWEPLGWGLDEWVATVPMAPYEDTVIAEAEISSTSSALTGFKDNRIERRDAFSQGVAGSREDTLIQAKEQGTLRGFTAGLGKTSASTGSITLADPLTALVQTVTGAVQLGYATNSSQTESSAAGTLSRDVRNAVEESTRIDRIRAAQDLAESAGSFADRRRLRAIRNSAGPRTLNLGLFSVVRHWLVTTVQSRVRPIVFVRAECVDRAFTHEDVFLQRSALKASLLDQTLSGVLDAAADSYAPAEPSSGASTESIIKTVHLQADVDDPAAGKGSTIRFGAIFAGHQDELAYEMGVTADVEGGRITCDVTVDRPLRQLSGWRITFVNPGQVMDDFAKLTDVTVTMKVANTPEQEAVTHTVPLQRTVRLHANRAIRFGRLVPREMPPRSSSPTPDLLRLLAHLEAHRAYYRLAIDLLTDPATRFERLSRRVGNSCMPSDMKPVGVTGVHLAFLTESAGRMPDRLHEPLRQLVATPAGGTFAEAMPGRELADQEPKVPFEAPRIAGTLTWPELKPPAAQPIKSIEDKDSELTPAKSPEPGASELGTQLTDARAALTKALEAVQKAQDALPKTIPAKPDAPSAGASSNESTEEPSAEGSDKSKSSDGK